jgi:hypothetical protein
MRNSNAFRDAVTSVAKMIGEIRHDKETYDQRWEPRRIPLREGQRWHWFEGAYGGWRQVPLDWEPAPPPSRESIGAFRAPVIGVMDTDSAGSDGWDEFTVWDVATGEMLMHDFGNSGRGGTYDTLSRYMKKLGHDSIEWFAVDLKTNGEDFMTAVWNSHRENLTPELAQRLRDEVGGGYRNIEKF